LTVILISLGLEFMNFKEAVFGAFAGIGLIVFAPIIGIIAIVVISFLSRDFKYLVASVIILLVFITAFLVSI
jgi:hypothetical protein